MALLQKYFVYAACVIFFYIFFCANAEGQIIAPTLSFGGELRQIVILRGKIVCADCDIKDAENRDIKRSALFLLRHRRGQVVMEVQWVNEPFRWASLPSHRIWVRAHDIIFEQMTAKKHALKQIELITLLRESSGTLDVFEYKLCE